MSPSDRGSIGDEYGVWSVDEEDQLQPEDTLDGEGDVMDRGFAPADRLRGSLAYGVTADEQRREETIAQRIRQEEPDPASAYGAPEELTDLQRDDGLLGGDDPDAIRAELDYFGGESTRVGRLIAPDEGLGPDVEAAMVAREGSATSWDAPEESAMHYLDDEEENLPEEDLPR